MSMTGLDVFDKTIHKTMNWLKDLEFELDCRDQPDKAYRALRNTLQSLRDRMPPEEAAHLGAQLPMLVRGIFYEGWNPAHKPEKIDKKAFLSQIRDQFSDEPAVSAETVARAVFKMIAHRVDSGEIEDVRQVLPKELSDLWPHDPNT